MSTHNDETRNYFAEKAEKYDDVDNQAYWVFSDTFYKEVLRRELDVFFNSHTEIKILDAGAGTGRWTLFLHEIFGDRVKMTGELIDISPEMLAVADRKLQERGINSSFSVSVGDIEDLSHIPNESYDLSISFYNVISFVENPVKALSEIHRVLKRGGMHLSVVANTYHSLYFAALTGRTDELLRVNKESKIAFNELMPPIHSFTPKSLKKVYGAAGFDDVSVYGGPNFIYPGMEETFISGNTESIQNLLKTDKNFQILMETELKYYKSGDIVGRGNTLLGVGTRL